MNWVSVAELLDRQVPVHWSEAVAVVAELCAVLLERRVAVPHPADVLIDGEGKLSIRAHDSAESTSAALGRMLHSLFATGSTPAPLRLFVSQAISTDRYQSISAFAEALASYEAPGRNKLIQAVYDRWLAMRAGAAAASVDIPLRPQPEPEKKPKPTSDARRLPRWAVAAAGVAVVSGAAAGAWLAGGTKVPSLPPISLSSLSSSVPAVIQEALAWVGVSAPGQVAAAEPEATNTKPARAAKRRRSAAAARTTNPDVAVANAAGLAEAQPATGSMAFVDATDAASEVTLAARVQDEDPAAPAAPVASELADPGETPGSFENAAAIADATVYSRAFPGVTPPVMMPRQIASRDAFTPGVERVSTIEVLVDESGAVEQVKLLSRPSPVLATMLLSAAKTWKFKPALNDGRPVKYLLRLDVATTRP